MRDTPELVVSARAAAEQIGFGNSSDERLGPLLAMLAASVPVGGRILELGTGTGVGTGWMVSGLSGRTDVEIVTVDSDEARSAVVGAMAFPSYVRVVVGDAVEQLPALGGFDLVFADAQGGKWERLDLTVGALRPGGWLLVDDMTPQPWWDEEQLEKKTEVTRTLLDHAELVAVDMDWATGVILCVRRR